MSKSRTRTPPSDPRRGQGARCEPACHSKATTLTSSELRLAKLCLDQAEELILWLDPNARLVYGNAAVCRVLGYTPDEFLSLHLWDISPRTPESWPARWSSTKQRRSETLVAELFTRNGEIVPLRFDVKYVNIEDAEYLFCSGFDLRKPKTPPERPSAESSPSGLFESSVDAIFVLQEGRLVDCNRGSSEQVLKMIRHDLEMMLHESGIIHERIARALEGEPVTFNWYSPRADGSRAHIECTFSRIEIEGKVRVLAIAVDVTARRKAERTLAQLSGRLLQLQDEERRRIARELHDTTGQYISALSMHLSAVLALPGADPQVAEGVQEGIALAESSLRDLRTLSYVLHPPLLDDLGLVSALRAYAEGYSERTGIRLVLDVPAHMQRLSQEVETTLFRIVQEGLSNIHRHSGSPTGVIRLKQTQNAVELEVIDHGRGLPPGMLESEVTSASRIGVGIGGMRERARQLGGRLTILSTETGTSLHVSLPITATA